MAATLQSGGGEWSLRWLRNLRWTAVAGQTATVCFVVWVLGLRLPLALVFPVIALTAISNWVLHWVPAVRWERPGPVTGLLVFDVGLLTALLHVTGGPHNPFTFFYLVHVALAAVVLPAKGSAAVAVACVAGYGFLFVGLDVRWRPGDDVCGVGPGMPLSMHLRGMLVAFGLSAACITFFAGRLQAALKRQAEELAKARLMAASNERFAAMATLAAGAAHELGTPLGTIAIAAGELVRNARQCGGSAEVVEDADLIREESVRCRAILDRLQAQTGDAVRRVDVAEIVAGVVRRFPASRVQVSTIKTGLELESPPEALGQALSSLVKNALDASPADAVVRMEVRHVGDRVEFAVEDRGAGLDPAARSHAGEPFFTTKPPGQGMGLGLFLVRLLAQRLDGGFRLESLKHGGTRAVLSLPGGSGRPLER
jgi:two-component system sensor histidine kinase RegB